MIDGAIQWETIIASVVVSATLVALVVGLWRLAPWGSATVATLRELADTRFEKIREQEAAIVALNATIVDQAATIAAARDEHHTVELQVAERDTRIAVLESMPDTAKMLATLNQMIVNQERILAAIEDRDAPPPDTRAMIPPTPDT